MLERRIQTSTGEFRYLERPGQGPALVFLHGLGDTADQFEPIAARLPDDWRLLAVDQRGHGASIKPAAGYSPFDFAVDASSFVDGLGLASAHFFGHSMGGRNAMVLAAREPQRVRSLILGDIGPDENVADIEATRKFFRGLPESFATTEAAASHWRERKPGYPDEILDLLMRNLEPDASGVLRWRYAIAACIAAVEAARSRDWWEFLSRVRCPALLLHVEGSTELSDEVAGRMRRELATMRYSRVPSAGHNFHLENPDFAAIEIRCFLESLGS